jgi:hypothetical protein
MEFLQVAASLEEGKGVAHTLQLMHKDHEPYVYHHTKPTPALLVAVMLKTSSSIDCY